MKYTIKKALSFLLTLVMLVNILPISALADGEGTQTPFGLGENESVTLTVKYNNNNVNSTLSNDYYYFVVCNGSGDILAYSLIQDNISWTSAEASSYPNLLGSHKLYVVKASEGNQSFSGNITAVTSPKIEMSTTSQLIGNYYAALTVSGTTYNVSFTDYKHQVDIQFTDDQNPSGYWGIYAYTTVEDTTYYYTNRDGLNLSSGSTTVYIQKLKTSGTGNDGSNGDYQLKPTDTLTVQLVTGNDPNNQNIFANGQLQSGVTALNNGDKAHGYTIAYTTDTTVPKTIITATADAPYAVTVIVEDEAGNKVTSGLTGSVWAVGKIGTEYYNFKQVDLSDIIAGHAYASAQFDKTFNGRYSGSSHKYTAADSVQVALADDKDKYDDNDLYTDGEIISIGDQKYLVRISPDVGSSEIVLRKIPQLKIKTAVASGGLPSGYKLLITMTDSQGTESYAVKDLSTTEVVIDSFMSEKDSAYNVPHSYTGTEDISVKLVQTNSDDIGSALAANTKKYDEGDMLPELYTFATTVDTTTNIQSHIATTTLTPINNTGVQHQIDVTFYEKRDEGTAYASDGHPIPSSGLVPSGKYFYCIQLKRNGKLAAYANVPATNGEGQDFATVVNTAGTFRMTVSDKQEFTQVDEASNNLSAPTVHYNPDTFDDVDVRLYRSTDGTIPDSLKNFYNTTDTFDGFDFWQNDTVVAGDKSKANTVIRVNSAYKKIYQVKVVVEDGKAIAGTDGIKLNVLADHATSDDQELNGYDFVSAVTPTDDAGEKVYTIVIENQATDTVTSIWTKGTNTISGNETFTLSLEQETAEICDGCPVILSNAPGQNYIVTYDTGKVERTNINHDNDNTNINHDNDNKVTTITHYATIKPKTYERALNPYDVLGTGAEYGVIANWYVQDNHTETNFATNKYENPSDYPNEVDANGTLPIPFLIGDIGVGRLHFGQATANTLDVYYNQAINKDEKFHEDPSPSYEVNYIPKDQASITSDVNSLINKLQRSANSYAQKSFYKPTGNNIDTTMFPDGITIYIDASNINFANAQFITKLENQTLVFNIPGENVEVNKSYVTVLKDDAAHTVIANAINSNTDGNGGDADHNKDVEDHILNHIVFNMYQAKHVQFESGPAGLFLVPRSDAVIDRSGGSPTGWLATGGKFVQKNGEWHFFRTQRRYSGSSTTQGAKKMMSIDGTISVPSGVDQVFTFVRETLDIDTGEWKDRVEMSNTGSNIDFPEISFKNASDEGDHYYLIYEVEGTEPDITYDKTKYVVKTVVTPDVEKQTCTVVNTYYKLNDTANENVLTVSYTATVHKTSGGVVLNDTEEKTRYQVKPGYLTELTKDGGAAADINDVKFTNEKNTIETGNLSLTKTATGKPTTDTTTGFSFTITLTPPTNVTLADNYSATHSGDSTLQSVTVASGTITGISLKDGEVLTISGLPVGTKYTINEINVPTGYTLDETNSNNLTGTIPGKINNEIQTIAATAINEFSASGTVQFSATKTYTNGNLKNNQFWFKLTQVQGVDNPAQASDNVKLASPEQEKETSATTDASSETVEFDPITFDQNDIGKTFYFMIEETKLPQDMDATTHIGATDHIKYDVSKHYFTVTVGETNGQLTFEKTASTTGDGQTEAKFANELLGGLKITKQVVTDSATLQVNNLANGKYYFKIYTDENCETEATTADGNSIGEIEIEITTGDGITKAASKAVENLKAGTYYVKEIRSNRPDIQLNKTPVQVTVTAGVKGEDKTETEAITITNTYATVAISGTKTWVDNKTDHATMNASLLTLKRKLKGADDSTYTTVYQAGSTTELLQPTWTLTSTGTNEQVYTYRYADLPKYDTDGNEYVYKVEEAESADYVMTSTDVTSGYGTNFINKWAEGSYTIKGVKGLNIGTLTDTEINIYKFKLEAITQNAPMPANRVYEVGLIKNSETGQLEFCFDKIEFKLTHLKPDAATGEPVPTTFVYEIEETGTVDGIDNDTRKHTVELTVSVNEQNPTELQVSADYMIGDLVVSNLLSQFTNQKKFGNLELSKSVTGTSDTEKKFSFEILLKNGETPVNAKYNAVLTTVNSGASSTEDKEVEFTNGKATVELTANQTILIKDIPDGYTYTVTETPATGYTQVSPEGTASGTITAGVTDSKAFVNTYEATGKVSFSAKKVFENGDWTGKSFKIKLSQVTADQSSTLVTGSALRMTSNPIEITINADTSGKTAVFTNAATFLKNKDQDDTTPGTYWFMLEEELPEGVDADHQNKDGIQYDTRKIWISVTLTDDKAGNLTVTKSPSETLDATFTNKQLGSVKVTKAFAGDDVPIPDAFKITYKIGDTIATEPLTIANADSGSGTEALPYEWTISDLPIGTVVTFTEEGIQVNGYSLKVNDTEVVTGTCELSKKATAAKVIDDNATTSIINAYEREKGKLRLTKYVTLNNGAAGSLLDGTYTFNITGTGTTPKTTGVNKVVTIKIENGEVVSGKIDGSDVTPETETTGTETKKWIEVTNLPTGLYEVSEVTTGLEEKGITLSETTQNPQTCTVTKNGGTGTIATATFTNNRGTGSLVLRKTVELSTNVSDTTTHYNNNFTFTITLTTQGGDSINGTFTTKTGKQGESTVTTGQIAFGSNGQKEVTLKHNEYLEIDGLPLKAKYTIHENTTSGGVTYALTSHAGDASGTISSTASEENFVNSYILDATTATFGGQKSIEGTDSTTKQFTFELYETGSDYQITSGVLIETITKGEITKKTSKPFNFTPITYAMDTQNGQTFYYVIKEKAFEVGTDEGKAQGWKTSEQEYHVEVKVSSEPIPGEAGHYKLTATVSYKDRNNNPVTKMDFLNTYEAIGSTTINATKEFAGGGDDWGGEKFKIKLTQVKANNSREEASPKLFNAQEQEVSATSPTAAFTLDFFKGIKTGEGGTKTAVNQEGEYWFMLEEEVPAGVDEDHPIKDGIQYDAVRRWIKVTVTDDKKGTLNVTKSVTSAPTTKFTNQQLGSVQISKAFVGHTMPADFKITASYQIGVKTYTKTLKTTPGGGAITPTGSGTETDPYIWTISDLPLGTEVTFVESGITVDGYSLTVTGTSTAYDGGNSATATAKAAVNIGEAKLVNKYERKTGKLNLSKTVKVGNQTIADTTLVDGVYKFTVKGTGTNPKTTDVSKTVLVTITGGKITVATVDGENAPINTDGTTVEIDGLPTGTYAVTEDTSGLSGKHIRLTAEPSGTMEVKENGQTNIPTAAFINSREVGELEIRKQVTTDVPLTLPDVFFTFKITLKDNNTPISGTFTASGKSNEVDVTAVTFDHEGTATVQLKATESIVISGIPQGASYTVKEEGIPAGFKASVDSMTGTIGNSRIVATFINQYNLIETSVTFSGKKSVTGTDTTKTFEFDLYKTNSGYNLDSTAELLQTVNTNAEEITRNNGKTYTFDAISYKQPGTFYYVIKEKPGNVNEGWNYATNEYHEQVVVRNRPDGQLVATITGTAAYNALNFTNDYSATGSVSFSTKKNYTHGTLRIGQFSFRLTQVDADRSEKAPQDHVKLYSPKTVAIDAEGKADFGVLTFKKNKSLDETGTYWFMIEEVLPDGIKAGNDVKDHIKYDTEKHWICVTVEDNENGTLKVTKQPNAGTGEPDAVFTNDVLSAVQVSKAFIGHEMPADFQIRAAYKLNGTDVIRILKVKATGSELAPKSGKGTEADPYLWEIEDLPIGTKVTFTESGLTVDNYSLTTTFNGTATTEYMGTVTVEKTVKTGAFINTYTRDKGSLVIKKTVVAPDGIVIPQNYTFTVKGADGKYYDTDGTASDKAVALAVLPGDTGLTLADLPTQDYTVTEVTGTNNAVIQIAGCNVTVDGNDKTVTIRKDKTETVTVTNSYTLKTGKAVPEITKKVTGSAAKYAPDETYTFKLTALNSAPMPAEDTVTISLKKGTLTGTATFGEIAYDKAGTYTYEITEVPGETEYMTYSQEKITVTVTVTEEETALSTSVAYQDDNKTLTNTYVELTSATVKKVWADYNDADGLRPAKLEIELLADGVETGETVTLNDKNSWTGTIDGLEKYKADGTEIVYSWAEPGVKGYKLTGNVTDGTVTTLTNTYTTSTSATVKKAWADYNNKDKQRPKELEIELLADDAETGKTVTLSEKNSWTGTIDGLEKYTADGTEIVYSWAEPDVEGYELTGNAKDGTVTTLTNTYTTSTSATVKKVWADYNDADGLRPAELEIELLADGVETGKTVTLNEENKWTGEITELEKYKADGTDIVYSWAEPEVEGYELTGNVKDGTVTTLTNTYTTSTSASVKKVWKNDENLSIRPAELTIELLADGEKTGKTVTLDASNDWTAEIDGLAKYKEDGPEIEYSWAEPAVDGYTLTGNEKDGLLTTLTNTYYGETSATVKKVWQDDGNRDGLRPVTLTVELLADGAKTGQSVKLSAANNWIARIDGLAKYKEDGTEIEYSWTEPAVEGYELTGKETSGTLTVLTNTHGPDETSVSVEKVWADDGKHPASVKVQLFADGKAEGGVVTLDAANGWKHTWTELCRNVREAEQSRAIKYTVAEVEVPEGYIATISGNAGKGFVITNTKETGKGKLIIEKSFDIEKPAAEPEEEEMTTDIEVVKVWDDNDNRDGNRPESITVHLYAGGEEVKTATLSEANGWRKTFGELPKFVDGHPIRYTVTEDPVKWYIPEIRGFVITNRYEPETTSVVVRKEWNDEGNEKFRPKSVAMKLSNGMSVILNEENGWTGVISGLPTVVNGEPAVYTWTEASVLGYEVESSVTNGNVTVVTNKPYTREGEPKRGKKPPMRGNLVDLEEYETPLGVEVIINHVGDCFD